MEKADIRPLRTSEKQVLTDVDLLVLEMKHVSLSC